MALRQRRRRLQRWPSPASSESWVGKARGLTLLRRLAANTRKANSSADLSALRSVTGSAPVPTYTPVLSRRCLFMQHCEHGVPAVTPAGMTSSPVHKSFWFV
eukprot:CAMPEP_0204569708 /NCGR_PEP_ID=MMETSP0661-20131031/37903_1 /ASSEMBLY_ACC=CAM_ASM_000606 /TAXON_ID=109239 /ORGANISM="Alexandrium margalefi, Strain AMGDE01CS-322" /LENGTH=101 /DNA_ID=CAMNT_0051577835 /DNA_START=139 /DNA_END=441 /DNA_ORIENTATION=-